MNDTSRFMIHRDRVQEGAA